MPTQTPRDQEAREVPSQQNELQDYLDCYITPTIKRLLHDDTNEQCYRFLTSLNAGKDRSHLVLELRHRRDDDYKNR